MTYYQVNLRIVMLLLAVSMAGCTLSTKTITNDVTESGDVAVSTNNATLALLDKAFRQSESGNLEVAAATIERALRIEPRNPRLWHRLALIRFSQGSHKLAANLAAKSNSFAANDANLISKNRALIVRARQQ